MTANRAAIQVILYCGFCGEKIADGEDVESGGHADAIIDKKTVKEATCTEEGYTGDKICPTCDKVLEQGKSTPANGHTDSEELRKVREAAVTWMVTQVKYIVQFVEKQQNQEMLLQN